MSDLLSQWRRAHKTVPLTSAELRFAWVAGSFLIFTSWAVGTMHLWSQSVAFVLAIATFASVPTGADGWRGQLRQLIRQPVFWLGLAWLLYALVGALNPLATYVREGNRWWMVFTDHLSWLPAGVDVPFSQGGPWRVLMIHGTMFLFGCAVWLAAVRRRLGRTLLMIVGLNGTVLAVIGIAQRLGRLSFFVAPLRPADAGPLPSTAFATFVYKNHAGAYLLLALVAVVALAGWYYDRAERLGQKSNPSGLLSLAALGIIGAILVSAARGATLTMLVLALLWLVGFVLMSWLRGSRRPWIAVIMVAIVGGVLYTAADVFSYQQAWGRIEHGLSDGGDFSVKSRQEAGVATLEMASDYRVWGTGAGSFAFVFPRYAQRHPMLWGDPNAPSWWVYAHNDLFQTLAEYGVIGCAILVVSLGYLLIRIALGRGWKYPLSLTLVSGLVALMAYSSLDFPLQCPAVLAIGVLFFALLLRIDDRKEA
jgi:hypothetical protein